MPSALHRARVIAHGADVLEKQGGFLPIMPKFQYTPQTLDMDDAAVTLTHRSGTASTEFLSGNVLFCDPNSSGTSEVLKLPPKADSDGDVLWIFNTGGEDIALQDDAGGSLVTIDAGLMVVASCDGTAWWAGTANIADASVTSAKIDPNLIQYEDVLIPSAQIATLRAAGVQVVPSETGLIRIPVAVYLNLPHGGTDYVQVNNSDHLALRYSASAEITELGTEAQCTSLLESSVDTALYCPNLLAASPAGFVPEDSKPIDIYNNGAAEYTTGDGNLSVRTYYRQLPIVAFT